MEYVRQQKKSGLNNVSVNRTPHVEVGITEGPAATPVAAAPTTIPSLTSPFPPFQGL